MCKKLIIGLLLFLLICICKKKLFLFNDLNIINKDTFTFQPPNDSKTFIDNPVIINPPNEQDFLKITKQVNPDNDMVMVDHYNSPKYLKYVNDSRGYTIYFEPDVEYMA